MKRFLIPLFAISMAAPAFADAEAFGEKMLAQNGSNASAQTMQVAVDVLSGDSVDEKIMLGSNEIVTQNAGAMTVARVDLAQEMGVDANDYTFAELAKMYIELYN